MQIATELKNTAKGALRAANAHLGAHDARWVRADEVAEILANAAAMPARALELARGLECGRVRVTPNVVKRFGTAAELARALRA